MIHREAIDFRFISAARERFGVATAFRVGLVVGESGEEIPSPYDAGSKGDELYRYGRKCGAETRRRRAEIAAGGR